MIMEMKITKANIESKVILRFLFTGVPDSKNFDVILMITLIRNLLCLPEPISGYDQLPLRTDTTPTADLTRIEYYKTKLANCEDGHMESSDFSTAWEDMIRVRIQCIITFQLFNKKLIMQLYIYQLIRRE